MAGSNTRSCGDTPCRTTPAEDDIRTEAALLAAVLYQHPCQLTVPELVGVMLIDPDDWSATDAPRRAIRELLGAGTSPSGRGGAGPNAGSALLQDAGGGVVNGPREVVAEGFGRNLYRERRRADLPQERLGHLTSLHRTEIGFWRQADEHPGSIHSPSSARRSRWTHSFAC